MKETFYFSVLHPKPAPFRKKVRNSSEEIHMRHSFTPQLPLGATPMAEIEIDYGSRHELVPILMALQHLYLNCSPVVKDILSLIPDCR